MKRRGQNPVKSEESISYYMEYGYFNGYFKDLRNYFLAEYGNNKGKPILKKLIISLGNTFLYELGTAINHLGYLIEK